MKSYCCNDHKTIDGQFQIVSVVTRQPEPSVKAAFFDFILFSDTAFSMVSEKYGIHTCHFKTRNWWQGFQHKKEWYNQCTELNLDYAWREITLYSAIRTRLLVIGRTTWPTKLAQRTFPQPKIVYGTHESEYWQNIQLTRINIWTFCISKWLKMLHLLKTIA